LKIRLFILQFFFIVTIFVLCSCQNEKDVLFRWDYIKNGFEWKTFGDPQIHPKYKGEILNGLPNGKGTLTYPDGSKHLGRWINGQKDLKRIENYPDGSKYVGEFKKGKKLKKKLLPGISPLSE